MHLTVSDGPKQQVFHNDAQRIKRGVSIMPTDFVNSLRLSAAEFSPPVRSLMDIDFYKFTMGHFIWRFYRDVNVTFKLIVRDNTVNVPGLVSETELRKCLDYARALSYSKTDIAWLRGQELYDKDIFSEGYIDFLRGFKLPPYKLTTRDGAFELTFPCKWVEGTMWETVALSIISELYYRAVLRNIPKFELEMIYSRAKERVYAKLQQLKEIRGLLFADFGQRRRHSFLWQQWVIGLCKDMMGEQFTGTSNAWMAFHHDINGIGTNAHELPMVLTALADSDAEKRVAPYRVLREWQGLYGKGLQIMLPDTYGTESFFAGAPEELTAWKGLRQDSGDPITRGELYIKWLKDHGADPREKLLIPSDGLDVYPMLKIYDHFKGRIKMAFGWGTNLTNDFRGCHPSPLLKPFSVVCKVVEANGRPCVKLSDNPDKATGPAGEVERYKMIFGVGAQVREAVLV